MRNQEFYLIFAQCVCEGNGFIVPLVESRSRESKLRSRITEDHDKEMTHFGCSQDDLLLHISEDKVAGNNALTHKVTCTLDNMGHVAASGKMFWVLLITGEIDSMCGVISVPLSGT